MDQDFLLQTKTAKTLYHEHAAQMPIFDYHCHLPSQQISDDIQFENITQAWLYGDHYKWRALRTNGVEQRDAEQSSIQHSQPHAKNECQGSLHDERSY